MLQPYHSLVFLNTSSIPYAFKAQGAQAKGHYSQEEFEKLSVSEQAQETATEPRFSRDFLGEFIPHARADLLTLARVPEKKQADPFLQHLAHDYWEQHKSVTNAHLALYRHTPTTLDIAKAPGMQEADDYGIVDKEDKVIGKLRDTGNKLDQLFTKHRANQNELKPESRKRDYALYVNAQKCIRELHLAYLREKGQQSSALSQAYVESFNAASAALRKLEFDSNRFVEISDDTALKTEPDIAHPAAPSVSPSPDHTQVAVKSFEDAVEGLETFVSSEEMKLSTIERKDGFIDKAYDFLDNVDKAGGFEFSAKVGMVAGGVIGAAVVGIVQFFLKFGLFSERRQLSFENAFRETLKKDLESILSEVSMNGPGGITPRELGHATGVFSTSINNNTDAIKDQGAVLNNVLNKLERLEQQFNSAVKQAGLQRTDSRASLDSGYSSTSSPLLVAGSDRLPAVQASRSRSPSPTRAAELEELKKAFAEVSEENKALHKKVEGLEAGQQQILEFMRLMAANQK